MTEPSKIEYGYLSINHKGEELCGDHVQVAKGEDGSLTLVLADGIGSGVVASILSTLTSTMLSRMVQGGIPLEDCVSALMETLPVAKDRGNVAYSTFTICKIDPDFQATIYNFDNPEPVFIHDGQVMDLHYKTLQIGGKTIHRAATYLDINDQISFFSDGAVYAGAEETLNFGWTRDQIAAFLQAQYNPYVSAKSTSTILVDRCDKLYERQPGDDTTCLTVRRRMRAYANLLVGPPTNKEDDESMLRSFFDLKGIHIVSRGSTCSMAARFLGTEVRGGSNSDDPSVPPISEIKGVDIATEGIVTLNKVYELAKDYQGQNREYFSWCYKGDGASQIARALFEQATDIVFYVGCAVNPAHQNDEFGFGFKMKMQIVDNLAAELNIFRSQHHRLRPWPPLGRFLLVMGNVDGMGIISSWATG